MSMVMERTATKEVRQFEIWLADLPMGKGSKQQGRRPVVVISNDKNNKYSPLVMVAPITSSNTKAKLPTHVGLIAEEIGFHRNSIVSCEQHIMLDKSTELIHKIITLPDKYKKEIERAVTVSTSSMFSRYSYN